MEALTVRLRKLLDEAMTLLGGCDGQLGLGIYREPDVSEQWKDEAKDLVSQIRSFHDRVKGSWHD